MTATPETPDAAPIVVSLGWPMFLDWMKDVWAPGQHIAIIGPTGEGKTTLAVPLLNLRKWVMVLDAKGEDETLEKSGFVRVMKLPLPRKLKDDIANKLPARIIMGGASDTNKADAALKKLMHDALDMVRGQGGWTLYADEFQVLADLRMFNLGPKVERMLVTARSKGTSVVVSFQAAAWVPKAATRQASFVILFPTRSRAMIKSTAEDMGRDWHELFSIMDALPPFHALVIPKSPRAPMVIIHPPELR